MKSKSLKKYSNTDGSTFTQKNLEKDLRKIIKLAGKLGWKYNQDPKKGKTFCVMQAGTEYPKGKVIKEYANLEFTWKR